MCVGRYLDISAFWAQTDFYCGEHWEKSIIVSARSCCLLLLLLRIITSIVFSFGGVGIICWTLPSWQSLNFLCSISCCLIILFITCLFFLLFLKFTVFSFPTWPFILVQISSQINTWSMFFNSVYLCVSKIKPLVLLTPESRMVFFLVSWNTCWIGKWFLARSVIMHYLFALQCVLHSFPSI